MSDDPHSWPTSDKPCFGACLRCGALYQAFLDGAAARCERIVVPPVVDDFVAIARRMKEIEAERNPKEPEPVVDFALCFSGEADEMITF